MGTKPDGSSYHWPEVKRIHPMRGQAVGTLGAYFNDDGVNLMHDEWFDPMAAETRAFFRWRAKRRPTSSCPSTRTPATPSIEPTAYVPRTVKEIIQPIGDRVQRRYAEAGLPHRNGGPVPAEDGGVPAPVVQPAARCTTPAAGSRSSTSAARGADGPLSGSDPRPDPRPATDVLR